MNRIDDLVELSDKHDILKQKYIRQSIRQRALQQMILDQKKAPNKAIIQFQNEVDHILRPKGSPASSRSIKSFVEGEQKNPSSQLITYSEVTNKQQDTLDRSTASFKPIMCEVFDDTSSFVIPTIKELTGETCEQYEMDRSVIEHSESDATSPRPRIGISLESIENKEVDYEAPSLSDISSGEQSIVHKGTYCSFDDAKSD